MTLRGPGVCNVAIGFQRRFTGHLGLTPDQLQLGHAGLNHLIWERAVHVDGENVPPKLIAEHGQAIADDPHLPLELELELELELVERIQAVPSYHLCYLYAHDLLVEEQRTRPSRAAEVAALEERLLKLYADPGLDTEPEQPAKRGGAFYSEAAVALIASLLGDRVDVQVVNTRNGGTLPFLTDDAVIEVPSKITKAGAVPLAVEPLYGGLGSVRRVVARRRGPASA